MKEGEEDEAVNPMKGKVSSSCSLLQAFLIYRHKDGEGEGS